MTAPTGSAPPVILDWRNGTTGEPEPCIICGEPAICRSPAKQVPCHKRCAETWIAAHARNDGHRDQLIRQHSLTLKRQLPLSPRQGNRLSRFPCPGIPMTRKPSSRKEATNMTGDAITGRIILPRFPFSMFDPVHLGIDENGDHVFVNLAERNMLLGGEPGAGKSSGLNLITAHGALSHDCKLILVDGKWTELGMWRHCADMFIGPSITSAIEAFTEFQQIMDTRYARLLDTGRRKITREDGEHVYLVVIDEYAYFSATVGKKIQREEFAALTRDLVARGRAAGVIVILATQRPSHQVIDPSMRDLFGYRWAFRCTTDSSSDTVLGQGWANDGYTAADIDPLARGVGWLLSETGVPRRIKAAYLTDDHIRDLATYAATLRHPQPPDQEAA